MAVQITIRRDTLANWTSKNPVLALAEFCVVTDASSDAQKIKIGDGSTAWNSLPYFNPAGGGGSAVWGGIGGDINNQTDLITLIGTKQNTITTGTNLQYFRGDLSLATFPTALSDFSNDVGFITSSALAPYLTSANAALTYVALTGDQTIAGTKTFSSSIRFATGQAIADANGNNLIGFPATIASAVNWLQVSNAISGNAVLWEAVGSDTNIGVTASTKGTGQFLFQIGGTTRFTVANTTCTFNQSLSVSSTMTSSILQVTTNTRLQGVTAPSTTDGGTLNMSGSTIRNFVKLAPASAIASFTIGLPATSGISDGQLLSIYCTINSITTLTLTPASGQTIVGAITTISAGQCMTYRWDSTDSTWYPFAKAL